MKKLLTWLALSTAPKPQERRESLNAEPLEDRVTPVADVAVFITEVESMTSVGDSADYRIQLRNLGTDIAKHPYVQLNVPNALQLGTSGPWGIEPSASDYVIDVRMGDIAAGENNWVDLRFTGLDAGNHTLTAFAHATGDTNVTDNVATYGVRVDPIPVPPVPNFADLGIDLTGTQNVRVDHTATYEATVINNGPASTDATALFVVPDGFDLSSRNIPGGFAFDSEGPGYTVGVNLENMAAGETRMVDLAFTILDGAESGSIRGFVSGDKSDPNFRNDVSTVYTNVVYPIVPPPVSSATLTIVEVGTAQEFAPEEQNAVLGKFEFSSDATLIANSVFVAIEAHQAGVSIAETWGDFELRNVATGFVVDGVRLVGSSDFGMDADSAFQIYRFDNFIVTDGAIWELRADGLGTAEHGYRFTAHFGADAFHTDLGGVLLAPSPSYAIDIDELVTSLKLDKVLPGGTVSSNVHQIVETQVVISALSLGTTDTAVENQRIRLAAVEARSLGRDTLLTEVHIANQAMDGPLINARDYTLGVIIDGVFQTLQSGVSAFGGAPVFDDLQGGGFVLPKNETVRFELFATTVSSFTPEPHLQVGFESFVVEDLNSGESLDSNQIIFTDAAPSIRYELKRHGQVFASQSSTPIQEDLLLLGSLERTVLRTTLRAEYEEAEVQRFRIGVIGSGASNVDRIELYTEGGTLIGYATAGNTGSDPVAQTYEGWPLTVHTANLFGGNFRVAEGDQMGVLIHPLLKSDVVGGVSGQDVRFIILGSEDDASVPSIDAFGSTSSNAYPGVVAETIVSPWFTTTGSAIGAILNADPNPDGTNVPTGIHPIGQFKVMTVSNQNTGSGRNYAVFGQFGYKVDAQNTLLSTEFAFFNKADSSTKAKDGQDGVEFLITDLAGNVITGPTVTGQFYVTAMGLQGSSVNTRIDSGSDATFVLEAEVLSPAIDNTITSNLQVTALQRSILWYDRDAVTNVLHVGAFLPDDIRGPRYRS